jgi:hypothetical protein
MTFAILNTAEMNSTNGGYINPGSFMWQDTRPLYVVKRNGQITLTREFDPATDQFVIGSVVRSLTK